VKKQLPTNAFVVVRPRHSIKAIDSVVKVVAKQPMPRGVFYREFASDHPYLNARG